MPRDVLVVGGTLAGYAAALAARRARSRVHLVVQDSVAPGPAAPFPEDVRQHAAAHAAEVPVPAPELPELFALRARRLRRWLEELGVDAKDEGWPAGLHRALAARCEREGVGIDDANVASALVGGPRGVSGAVLVHGARADVAHAHAVVLATSDVGCLFAGIHDGSTPSGLALGVHAGCVPVGLEQVAFWAGRPGRGCGGLAVDGRGQTAVAGLVAAGGTAAAPWRADPALAAIEDVVRALEAGTFEGPPGKRAEAVVPAAIDEPLAPGFVAPKVARVRELWSAAAGSKRRVADVQRAESALVQLRGEATDYARARFQGELHLFRHLTDVAVLGVRALLGPSRGLHVLDV